MTKPTSPGRQRAGFTLIELLVVIAIIAILAAILFPVFNSARDRAKLAKCMVHLKECGAAALLYTDDNDGRLPVPRITDEDGAIMGSRWWPEGQCAGGQEGTLETGQKYTPPKYRPLNKYVRTVEMFRCPSEKKQKCAGVDNTFPWKRFGSSYNMSVTFHYPDRNSFFYTLVKPTGSSKPEHMYVGRAISELKNSRRMILMGERPIHQWYGVRKGDPNPRPVDDAKFLGHSGDAPWTPIVFCDGHVDYVLMTPGLNGANWALAERGWCPFASREGD